MKSWKLVAGLAAIVLGSLAAVAGSPRVQGNARIDVASLASAVEREEDHVTALELAAWIRERRADLRVVDVRAGSDYDSYHIPGAERISLDSLVSNAFKPNETIVLYSDGGAHAAQGWVFLKALGYSRVYFLRGGLHEWLDDVMNPSIAADASDSARSAFAATAELSRYFGGVPRSVPATAAGITRTQAPAAPTAASVRRRGC
jgi:rhodanese-related sulfurtransferase